MKLVQILIQLPLQSSNIYHANDQVCNLCFRCVCMQAPTVSTPTTLCSPLRGAYNRKLLLYYCLVAFAQWRKNHMMKDKIQDRLVTVQVFIKTPC